MKPEDVVRAELRAWSSLDIDQIMAHFAEDATLLPGFGRTVALSRAGTR